MDLGLRAWNFRAYSILEEAAGFYSRLLDPAIVGSER